MSNNAPFTIRPDLTAVAIAYRNADMIADIVMPRIPCNKQVFEYWRYNLADGITIPNTHVGRTSRPNKVTFNATSETAACDDHALDSPVPKLDKDNAPANYDPYATAAEGVSNLILLDREVRTAGIIFSSASYASGNRTQLTTSTDQWDDTDHSTPLDQLEDGIEACVMRPNMLVLGQRSWRYLRKHPQIVASVFGNNNTTGRVTRQQLADVLEIKQIIVGEAFVNNAKPGQDVSVTKAWGTHAALLFIDPTVKSNLEKRPTFGATFQFGNRISGTIVDPHMGMRGGEDVRVGESVNELVLANDLGYFIQDVISS